VRIEGADVYLNYATRNTGSLFVFDNPGLQYYGCRAHSDPAKDQPECRGTLRANIVVVSFGLTQVPFSDPNYKPYPERINIHDSELAAGG
jgi:hypothetical protein